LLFAAAAGGWAALRQHSQAHEAALRYESAALYQQVAINWLEADALTAPYFTNPTDNTRLAVQQKEDQVSQDLQRLREIETTAGTPEELAQIDSTIAQTTAIAELRTSVMDTIDQGDPNTAAAILVKATQDSGPGLAQLQAIAASERQQVQNLSAQSTRTADLLAVAVGGVIVAIILLGLISAVVIARSVVQPLAHLRETARDIGDGDHSARAKDSGPREIRELAGVLNATAASIQQRDAALRVSEAYWRSLIQNTQDVIAVVDAAGVVRFASPSVQHVLGYSPDDFAGMNTAELIHPDDLAEVLEFLALVVTGADREGLIEYRCKHADGGWVHIEARAMLVHDENGDFVVVNARDLSERRRDQEKIVHMAYHDALTGLPNRLLFTDRLQVALAQARRNADKVCLISIDLDRFKIINDTLGHSAGDELLRGATGRLEKLVREGNTVARIGGDEFMILLSACESAEDGVAVAQRLVEAFRLPFALQAGSYHATASVGLSVYPDDGSDAESLLSASDIAMYAAKDAGRDTFRRYTSSIENTGASWLALEAELRRAIEQGELRVYYQPQVNVSSQKIVGVEALVRWQHPTRGLIAPMEFIPLAEEIGLIVPLGEYVLRHACRDAVQWQREGVPPVRLAVNISHRQVSEHNFVSTVRRIITESGLTPSLLELEITETAALRNVERTRAVAIGLAELGVRLSIDDFGAGSTSLRYLQDFPITTLKIDRGFITGVANNPSNSAIATSVIALGHQLNLNVIAEGVETQDDLDFLQSRDCDEYQGFFCSRPIPLDELKELLTRCPTASAQPAVASVSDAVPPPRIRSRVRD
jgi:diguanylate cyclase (GGDEF)-like protein/PAS domain S-box-containing protein